VVRDRRADFEANAVERAGQAAAVADMGRKAAQALQDTVADGPAEHGDVSTARDR
jgi:hypothetical protein